MTFDKQNHRFSKLAAAAIGAVSLGALALSASPAKAQVPYLGIDLGNGIGTGLGVPPSAYASPYYYTPYTVAPTYTPYYVAPAPAYIYPW